MPLKKLFHKRNSLKKRWSVADLANEEIEKLKLSAKMSSSFESLETKINLNNASLLRAMSTDNACNDYEFTEKENEDNARDQSLEVRRQSAPPELLRKLKSVATKEVLINGRKKCISENTHYETDLIGECASEKLISLTEKQLEILMGHRVDQWIKESIMTAVKVMHGNCFCEENIEDNCNKIELSSSTEELNIQKKWSDSLAEYEELEEETQDNSSGKDGIFPSRAEMPNVIDVAKNSEVESISLDGYLADCEESSNCNATQLNSKVSNEEDQVVAKKGSSFTIGSNEEVATSNLSNSDDEGNDENNTTTEEGIGNANSETTDVLEQNKEIKVDQDKTVMSDNLPQIALENNDDYHIEENESQYENVSSLTSENGTGICQKDNNGTSNQSFDGQDIKNEGEHLNDELSSPENDSNSLPEKVEEKESNDSGSELMENCPKQQPPSEDEKKINWKVGYLHVKLPHKTRTKGNLKAWKKRYVSIQPDEFVNDPKHSSVMISVFSGDSGSSRKHGASFWKSVSCKNAVIYRSNSRSHKYAFTITEDNKVVIHLAADHEALSQEWMAATRSILWPPSPVIQLEKMLYGKEFEISIIDNDFSYRAGLLGMYGYLTVTPKKLILVHPNQGYVIQEWYLNTVDKFELIPQSKVEDAHKVLSMTTCSDSSTGQGQLLMFCPEAVAMLQAIASTIHQILTEHIQEKGGKYEKELAEMADWLIPSPAQAKNTQVPQEDYYKVPPRQVKSLLDIPNFIFGKPLEAVASTSFNSAQKMEASKILQTSKTNATRASQDSGISSGNLSEDFLNCSSASFVVGGGTLPGKSSDSELSDAYTPPMTPEVITKRGIVQKKQR